MSESKNKMPKLAQLNRAMIEFNCEEGIPLDLLLPTRNNLKINSKNIPELTPEVKIGRKLFECIIEDDLATAVSLLIKHNRSGLEYLDKYANTPLLMACYLGRKDFVRYFVSIGANYKRINLFGMFFLLNIAIFTISNIYHENYFRSKRINNGHLCR